MTNVRAILGSGVLGLSALVACAHDYPRGAASMQAPPRDDWAIAQLSAARCDREQTCGHIGPGGRFASFDTCDASMRQKFSNELDAYNCPGGLERSSVGQCTSVIRAEQCGDHPVETLARFEKCRSDSLCMEQGYRYELTR